MEDKDIEKQEVNEEITSENLENKPTPEEEWAKALKINFTPPPLPGSVPPPIPQEETGGQQFREPGSNTDFQPQNRQDENPGHNRNIPQDPMPSTYLIWSILTTVFCCFIPGILAIVFSSQVSSKYFAGDIEGARRSSRLAEIWIIVSFVLGVLSATLYLPFMLIVS